jgi:nucleolar protein 9
MGRNKSSKRILVRNEKRRKRHEKRLANEQATQGAEHEEVETKPQQQDGAYQDDEVGIGDYSHRSGLDIEFFGMLSDEEQEYFRHADELLELNDFPSPDDRAVFLQSVYTEAEGKELKLACSQSCSRLMERLILLSNTRQKKHLFQQFSGHFPSLITHRFASHCCEKLFLQSAPIVTEELGNGLDVEMSGDGTDSTGEKPQASMEDLFLYMLDELEEHLTFLLSERYASHTMRLLLIILSGRPLDQVKTKSLLQSKKKEHITVSGVATTDNDLASQTRAVPGSFNMAIRKIISDTADRMDEAALRVLSKHPTGNPTLQLLLELDISLNAKPKEANESGQQQHQWESSSLLSKLIPGAPSSFSDPSSMASEFVNGMVYDPIGSRLVETLVTHCPGKIFKGLQSNIFGPRIQAFLRNDIASYPAIRALNRLSKEDLVEALNKSLPQVALFVEKGRFNVLKTFFERCNARGAKEAAGSLLDAISEVVGSPSKNLVWELCHLEGVESSEEAQETFQQDTKSQSVLTTHASQLLVAMLNMPGRPSNAVQDALLSLTSDQQLLLATFSAPASTILTTALSNSSSNPIFHKSLAASLIVPHCLELAQSQYGHRVLCAIIALPSKGDKISIPFHLKQSIVSRLAEKEQDLRESWTGRSVWRTWKGDVWVRRRGDWVRWAKETDPEDKRKSQMPKPKQSWGSQVNKNPHGRPGGWNKHQTVRGGK